MTVHIVSHTHWDREWYSPFQTFRQVLLPLVTLAHRLDAKNVAVIGQGTGMSSHSLLASPAIESLVTIEIEPVMVEASRQFYPANPPVFDAPRREFRHDRVEQVSDARHRGMLRVILGEMLEHRRLFEQAGFKIARAQGIPGPFPLALGDNTLSRSLLPINHALIRLARGLFSYQIFFSVESLPSLEYLLREANEQSTLRAAAEPSGAMDASARS